MKSQAFNKDGVAYMDLPPTTVSSVLSAAGKKARSLAHKVHSAFTPEEPHIPAVSWPLMTPER